MVSFLIDNWMLVLVAVLSGLALLLPTLQIMGKAGLSPTQAVLMINREKAQIVDVRSPEEFSTGHLIGAKNIAMDMLESSLGKAINDKKRPLILVCASGVRSQRAQKIATKLGFEQAHSLSGGTTAVCPYCNRAKQILKARGVEHIEEVRIDLSPDERDRMMALTGRRTVPQIFIGETHVGGCDDLMALDSRGGLMPMLQAS